MKKRGKHSRFDFLNTGKKKLKSNRSAQLEISFGMIFSIILIIAFLAVAIYAIILFLNVKKCSDVGTFKDYLQGEIDRAYGSDESSYVFNDSLASGIKLCFINLNKESKGADREVYTSFKKYGYVKVNMFYWPLQLKCPTTFNLNHLNITEITKNNNPYCISSIKGKISLKIEKSFYDALVCINCAGSSGSSGGSSGNNSGSNNYAVGPSPFCGSSTLASCSSNAGCVKGGCSGQVCGGINESIITTCEYKNCYDDNNYNVSCECVSGKCRWN